MVLPHSHLSGLSLRLQGQGASLGTVGRGPGITRKHCRHLHVLHEGQRNPRTLMELSREAEEYRQEQDAENLRRRGERTRQEAGGHSLFVGLTGNSYAARAR